MSDNEFDAPVVALAGDLIFAARIRGTAQAAGAQVEIAAGPDALLERVRRAPPRRVLIDLDARAHDPVALIRTLRSEPAAAGMDIVAFVSHVREEAIAAARDAGADRVLARGAFVRQLAGWVQAPE